MALAIYKQTGDAIEYPAATPVATGEVVVVNQLVGVIVRGITAAEIAAGDKAALQIEGTYIFPKQAALAIAQGEHVYWDDAAGEMDKTTTNVYAGVCVEDAAGGDSTVTANLQNAPVDAT